MRLVALQRQPSLLRGARSARPCRTWKRWRTCAQAAETSTASEVVDGNINQYCTLDAGGRRPIKELSMGEKEQLFLEALSAYYNDGKPTISDTEFDNLKDELVWEGSKVAVLNGDELKFLEAAQAYNAGRPIMSDEEYDALKLRLRQSSSAITQQGPRCSLDGSKAVLSDARADYGKMVALNIPPALIVLGALFSIDNLTGVEVLSYLPQLPPPYGVVFLWGFLLPVVYILANAIANALFKDALILKGQCPNCGTDNTTYFGDILTVQGNRDRNTVECAGCKAKLTFDAITREVELTEMPKPEAPKGPKKAGPKKAAE